MLRRQRQEDLEFKARLGYIARFCLKIKNRNKQAREGREGRKETERGKKTEKGKKQNTWHWGLISSKYSGTLKARSWV